MDAIGTRSGECRIVGRTAVVDEFTAQVSIEDSGSGIPADKISRLFEPFFTTKEAGMGMGLSIARTIVQTHGGRIWGENREGGGAVFRFTLPLIRSAVKVDANTLEWTSL
jgi:signal transduction histidine kinase